MEMILIYYRRDRNVGFLSPMGNGILLPHKYDYGLAVRSHLNEK